MPERKCCIVCKESVCRLQCASFATETASKVVEKKRYKRRTVHSSINIDGVVVETFGEVEDSRQRS